MAGAQLRDECIIAHGTEETARQYRKYNIFTF